MKKLTEPIKTIETTETTDNIPHHSKLFNFVSRYTLITLGTLILTLGVYFFKFPNHFSTGGVSGISIIFGSLQSTISTGTLVMIINAVLLSVGFLILGKDFCLRTVYSSLLFSFGTMLLEKIVPLSAPLTDQPLLELMFGILLPAIGSAILFNEGASSGGTDITAAILKKYTDINIGRSMLICDSVIAAAAIFVFGIKTGLFSIFGLILKAFVIDNLIESFNQCKFFIIVTEKYEPICEFITETLHHGATISDARGAFTNSSKKLIYIACRRSEALPLKSKIKEIDKNAFMFITNTSEIIGKGFRLT
ncbi:MAG: YitT family protein [Clostridia bacterium]